MFWLDLKKYPSGTSHKVIMKDFATNEEFVVERGVYIEPDKFRIVQIKGWWSLQYLIDD